MPKSFPSSIRLILLCVLVWSSACTTTPTRKDPVVTQPTVTQPITTPPAQLPVPPSAQPMPDVLSQAQISAQQVAASVKAFSAQLPPPLPVQVTPETPGDRRSILLSILESKTRAPDEIVITAVGDVSQPTKQWPAQTNALKTKAFAPTQALIDSGDLVSMNLENPVSDKNPKAKKKFSFTSAPERLGWYMDVGFNLFSLANNHIADANQEGIDDTIMHLKEKSKARNTTVYWAGAAQTKAAAEEAQFIKLPNKDTTIAFFSTGFSKGANVSKFWSQSLIPKIKAANARADIVIVSVHAGKEYQHIPEKNLVELYRKWVDAGADLVIGHHPHVIRPVELYKGAVIMHSLGNFVFASRTRRYKKSKAKMYGLFARVILKDARVQGVELTPLWVNNSADWIIGKKRMKNANFTPKPLSGPFADAFFEDMTTWTQAAGLTSPTRVGNRAVYIIPKEQLRPKTKPVPES